MHLQGKCTPLNSLQLHHGCIDMGADGLLSAGPPLQSLQLPHSLLPPAHGVLVEVSFNL
jgi:hypothetical protein